MHKKFTPIVVIAMFLCQCKYPIVDPVDVNPIASFTLNNNNCIAPCDPGFNNTSQNAVSYLWEFGDGNSSTDANPSYTYNTPGNYDVKLTATSSGNTTNIQTQTVTIIAADQVLAQFSVSNDSCFAPCDPSFLNESLNATSYLWDLGDGNTSTDENPSYTYDNAGVYSVTLTASGNNSQEDEFSQNITILEPSRLSASFSVTQNPNCPTLPCEVIFTNTSEGATSYQWDLDGDGAFDETTSNTDDLAFSYTQHFRYPVKLVASNGTDQVDTTITVDVIPTTFTSVIGSLADDSGSDIIPTSDGNYAITGRYNQTASNTFSFYFVKLNSGGDILLETSFGSNGYSGQSIVESQSGGFYVLGNNSNRMYLAKLDANGLETNNTTYQDDSGTRGNGMVETNTGDLLIAAQAQRRSTGENNHGYFIYKFSSGLAKKSDEFFIWTGIGDGPTYGGGRDITLTNDGFAVVAGDTRLECNNDFGSDFNLAMTQSDPNNLSGNTICQKVDLAYGGSGNFTPNDIQEVPSGGFVMAGRSTKIDVGGSVVKTNGTFSRLWEMPVGDASEINSSTANALHVLADGSMVIVGFSRERLGGDKQIFLVKMDTDGNTLWKRNYGGTSTADEARAIVATEDSGFLITGVTASFGAKDDDVLLLKTDSEGRVWE